VTAVERMGMRPRVGSFYTFFRGPEAWFHKPL
jgi:hypothetical protein